MNLKVQRFPVGHKLYSVAKVTNTDPKKGLVGTFECVFGQWVDDKGNIICFNLERKDTLIAEGTRKFHFYNSPENKLRVPIMEDEPGLGTFNRCLEVHPANFPYELKGCSAPCIGVNAPLGMGITSRAAWDKLMALINNQEGTITYETLKLN